ncbi:MAG: cytochrome b/b6 domain-containing protein [Nitrospira sp.]|nr:cytochrome b/b6 domain-containing protein [Nitrospira sp.]
MALHIQSEEVVSREGELIPIAEPSVLEAPSAANDHRGSSPPAIERVYRHRLPVRISHWLNVPFLIILIMSGLQIFNAHPALYWAIVLIVTVRYSQSGPCKLAVAK